MKRIEIAMAIGLVAAIAMSSVYGFAADCRYLRENVLRVHILANSDSADDQELKLAVRDGILAKSHEIFESAENLAEAEKSISAKMQYVQELADKTIADKGYSYTAKAELVNMYFNTRVYDEFYMPAGRYDAIRVTIGSGEGKNWWCVAYPPMCIEAATPKENAVGISRKILSMGQTPIYKPKLAVVELWEGLKEKFRDKSIDIQPLSID